MERTQTNINKVAEILNNNKKCKEIMAELGKTAAQKGLTTEQWNQFKRDLLTNLFLKLAQKDKGVMDDLALDLWEELKK